MEQNSNPDTRLREAAQEAVEAFDRFYGDYGDRLAAIDRLRAALAAPAAPLDEDAALKRAYDDGYDAALWSLGLPPERRAGVTVAPEPQETAKEPQSLASPRPGLDRLECPGCGMRWELCQRDLVLGPWVPCCARCRHDVRPCVGGDAS